MLDGVRVWALCLIAASVGPALVDGRRVHAQLAVPETLQVAMPDGVTLATDVWRPLFDNSPRPVLLRRTPYGRAVDAALAQNVVAAGYALVSQDVRGRGQSGGVFEPFLDDKVDGKATVDWIATQAWSNDRVGSYSASAEGIVQYMAMAAAPEALRCAHLGMPTHDAYEGLFPGGAWRTDLGTQWLTDLGAASVIGLWKSHEARDAYWNDGTLSTTEMMAVDHPVFILGGMFDIFAPSQVRAFRELRTHASPAAREDVFLVLGPWTHGGIGSRSQGQLLYPEDAPYLANGDDFVSYFAWCLQGGPRPAFAPVRYYLTELSDEVVTDPSDQQQRIVAHGEWREAESFPPPGVQTFGMYLQADDRLRGALPPATANSVSIPVDPGDPVPSLGGGNLSTAAGPFDQSAIDARPDVYATQTEAGSESVEIVGNLRAELWVASATSDADVVLRAEVLTPLGKAVALTDGIQRGRFVQGLDQARALVPDEPTLFRVDFGPIAVRLPPGHTLRFALSGSSAPRYEPNPNTALALASNPVPIPTTLSLFRDAAHPSRILIPVARGMLPGSLEPEAQEPEPPATDAGLVPGADAGHAGDAGTDVSEPEVADAGAWERAAQDAPDCGCRLARRGSAQAGLVGLGLLVAGLGLRRRARSSRSPTSAQ